MVVVVVVSIGDVYDTVPVVVLTVVPYDSAVVSSVDDEVDVDVASDVVVASDDRCSSCPVRNHCCSCYISIRHH